MGSAKICRNGNESTFRQTSVHHAGTSNNFTCKYSCTTQAIPHTPPAHDKRFTCNKHPYTPTATQDMHMHVPSNYSPSRFDTETRPRSMRESVWCLTRRDVGERRREYGGEASSHQQLYINQSRFNYQKWRIE